MGMNGLDIYIKQHYLIKKLYKSLNIILALVIKKMISNIHYNMLHTVIKEFTTFTKLLNINLSSIFLMFIMKKILSTNLGNIISVQYKINRKQEAINSKFIHRLILWNLFVQKFINYC